MSKRTKWLLVGIILLAGVLRFAALDRIPPGVYPDEAINGTQGWEALQTGNFKMFYPENNGREGLWINLIGLTEKAFGPNEFSLHFWSAITGTLTVLGVFFMARELFASDTIALLASFFLATSFWHINFSRISFPAIMVPLFLPWGLYFLLRAWRASSDTPPLVLKGRLGGVIENANNSPTPPLEYKRGNSIIRARSLAIIGGVLFGLGFYSYIAYRFAPFVAIALFAVFWKDFRETRRHFLVSTGIWLAAVFFTALPIGIHFLHNPQDFFGRASQVSVFSTPNPAVTILKDAVLTLGMFNIRGDCNQRHNMACWPQLAIPVGLLFLAGIYIALRHVFKNFSPRNLLDPHMFLFVWAGIMAAPAILTWEGIPHALRSIGVIPPVFMLAGIGGERLWSICKERASYRLLFVALLILIGCTETYRYFGVWARSPWTEAAFTRRFADIGDYINSLPPNENRFVIVNSNGINVPHTNPNGETRSLPMPFETVLFETINNPQATYLLPEEASTYQFPAHSTIIPLEPDANLTGLLRERFPRLLEMQVENFSVFNL